MAESKPQSAGVLVLIGLFKLLKAALLFTVGLGLHHMLHHDAEEFLRQCVHAIRIDPENRYIHAGIAKVTGLNPRTLHDLSVGTFAYAALFAVEGLGLVLRKRWAEYLTVISTTGLLPLEIYELVHRPRPAKMVVLVLNLAIVAYLIFGLYRTRARSHATAPRNV
jgi:uncharacterized membrane protein (DUF2068 family)